MSSTLDLAMGAPWIGVIPGDAEPYTLHAVTDAAILGVLAGCDMVTACQLPGVKLLSFPLGSESPVSWAARHKLPEPLTLCRACWLATGKQRPACAFVPREEQERG